MKEIIKNYIWTAFMILCALWAFWGCWEVKDMLVRNSDFLTTLNAKIKSDLPKNIWYEKVVFGIGFMVVFLFWITLPLQIIWIYTILSEKGKTAKEKIKKLTDDLAGQFFGMVVIVSIWIGGVLLIAYFGGLLDLLWLLFLIGFIAYSLFAGLLKRFY